ncbi:MAG: hypothetical protein V4493_01380 [Pseudomonadota bacterium]
MAFANYLRNKIIDWYHRGQTFAPPATLYFALCTSAPTAASAGTEVSTSGTGYARTSVAASLANWAGTDAALSTAVSTGTSGTTSNNISVSFGTATTSWGTISHWEAYDAVTGGNRQYYGTIVDGTGAASPRSIAAGDPVSFPASALSANWS